jgi:hypothetical protein
MSKRKKRLEDCQVHRSQHSCEAVFKLLCPVKNDDWLPGWREQREIIYTDSGSAEAGCVFRVTNQPHLMGSAVLVNTVFKPFEKIQYAAINPDLVYQIQWDLTAVENGTELTIARTWTALTADAENFLQQLDDTGEQSLPMLFEMAEYYLTYGKMMSK